MRVKLKELGEVITGNTPSKMILDYWDSDDISFVKPDIISDNGITTIVESSEYLSEKAREKAQMEYSVDAMMNKLIDCWIN